MQPQSTENKLFSWFTSNHKKFNPGKCHILLSEKNFVDVCLEEACLTSSSTKILLGITTDSVISLTNIFLTYAIK